MLSNTPSNTDRTHMPPRGETFTSFQQSERVIGVEYVFHCIVGMLYYSLTHCKASDAVVLVTKRRVTHLFLLKKPKTNHVIVVPH